MKRRVAIKRRNPAATIVRKFTAKRIPSARDYRRHDKHKCRPDVDNRDGFFVSWTRGSVSPFREFLSPPWEYGYRVQRLPRPLLISGTHNPGPGSPRRQ